jgi:gliding motility-associated-like protein
MPAGAVVSATGVYTDTLKFAGGCDSLITKVNLTVGVTLVQNQAVTLCTGQTYTLVTGQQVATAGVYRDTLRSALGCDSAIVNTTVTVKAVTVNNVTRVLCAGGTYTLPSGKVLNTTGIFRDTLKFAGGCDSLVTTVNLTVNNVVNVSRNATVCVGEVYTLPSGKVVNATGIYKDTVKYAVAGCDSLITTLNLIKLPTIFQNKSVNLCAGQTYTFPTGVVATTSGVYGDTIRSVRGCDSLITLTDVRIGVARILNFPASVCQGSMYKLPWGPTVSTQGIYSDTLRNASGCDSIIRKVTLTVNANPAITVKKSNDVSCTIGAATLTASGASRYSWTSPTGTAIDVNTANTANAVVRPRVTTTYKVKAVSSAGCVTEDSMQVVVTKGSFDALVPSAFTPNNDGKNDCFGVSSWGVIDHLQFTIYNRWGAVVFQTTDPSRCWDGTYKGVAQDGGTFVYHVTGNTLCGAANQKGTIVLIR